MDHHQTGRNPKSSEKKQVILNQQTEIPSSESLFVALDDAAVTFIMYLRALQAFLSSLSFFN